jgi:hypothetical protein
MKRIIEELRSSLNVLKDSLEDRIGPVTQEEIGDAITATFIVNEIAEQIEFNRDGPVIERKAH